MDPYEDDSSSEEKDIKPLIFPSPTTASSQRITPIPSIVSNPKRWSPKSLQDVNRKSAFLPYKQTSNTVLTNLQRGNTQAETPELAPSTLDFHIRAGQGDLTEQEVKQESDINALDKNNFTALHWASAYGQVNAVKLLLNYKAKVNLLGLEEESALLLAAAGGHLEVVRVLLNSGAGVNHVDHVSHYTLQDIFTRFSAVISNEQIQMYMY